MRDLPENFINAMKSRLGLSYNDFVTAINAKTPTSIRLHPYKINNHFDQSDSVDWHPHGKYLEDRPAFTLDPLFQAGTYYVQEASSMSIYQALAEIPIRNQIRILDLCAAPGGKSTLVADYFQEKVGFDYLLVTNEVIKSRSNILEQNIVKWGYSNVIVTSADSAYLSKKLPEYFDLIIADCPCSGEGLFRKDETAASHWSLENVELCDLRQKRILHEAHSLLKSGGHIIYSTCTYNEDENMNQVECFCTEYRLQTLEIEGLEKNQAIEKRQKNSFVGYQFYPHKIVGEGFFVSLIQKEGEAKKASNKKEINIRPYKHPRVTMHAEIDQYEFRENELVAFPKQFASEIMYLGKQIPIKTAGTSIGKVIHKDLIPHHEMALSCFVESPYEEISLSKEESLNYLRKQELTGISGKGWRKVTYKGHGLGWVKLLGNRINNYYPMQLRILK